MNKETLRKVYLEKRRFLDKKERDRRDSLLQQYFRRFVEVSRFNTVHLYLSIAKFNEPDTFALANYLLSQHSSVRLVVPRTMPNGELLHYRFRGSENLTVNKWGIPEPEAGELVDSQEIDLVIIPLITFDLFGNRIGYGKGYYDRFLATCREDVKKIGYTFSVPIDKMPFAESYDVPLDGCVCPLGYIDFSITPGIWKG